MIKARSSVFLEVVESLSKSSFISEGDVKGLSKEILIQASQLLNIDRVNSWIADSDNSRLKSLIAYDRNRNEFTTEASLHKKDLPNYFDHIVKNEIIISSDAQKEPFNAELLETYLEPLDIRSMMEVPIISGGKFKGIICFEHLGSLREWNNDEQHFALALTQLMNLALETKEKNQYRDELEKMVKEKSVLIAEINHRVKNNLAIITALIRGESQQAKDDFHRTLFDNLLSKTYSLSSLQEAMYQTQNFREVKFDEFLPTLVGNLNYTFGSNLHAKMIYDTIEPITIEVNKAIPLALISNEIMTNSYKYAFKVDRPNEMHVSLRKTIDGKIFLSFRDNGGGLPDNFKTKGTGFELMNDLVDQIDGELNVRSSKEGTEISIIH
jgi:two-component sensor histidine kinase